MFNSFFIKTALILVVFNLSTSCSKDDKDIPATATTLTVQTFKNLNAPQSGGNGNPTSGVFTKFSFSKNEIVTDDNWDIAFRGTTILVNGGTLVGIVDEPTRKGVGAISIATNTLEKVLTLPDVSTFKQDGASTYAIPTGAGNGWYNYDSANNLINPIAGKIFVVKTHDGKYAKFEILSYYKDAPASPNATSESRYFTFRFAYQPTGTSF